MEHLSGEQLQSLSTQANLLPLDPRSLLTLLPIQPSPTLPPLHNPTDQQILSIITGDNPNGAFQTVAKYSTNPLAPDTSNQIISFLQPTLAGVTVPVANRQNSWTLDSTSYTLNPTPHTQNPLTLEQLSRVESTAVNLWQNLLPDHRQLDVNFQITDLANGEIAQAQVTKFSPTGLPIGGTILIDRNAQGAGWFVDSTPLDWSEFTPFTGGSFQAKPDSAAAGKYDLFTALLHELGHISGFGHSDTTFKEQQIALSSDGNHIANPLYANDLMASELQISERRLPSELDIALSASPIVGQKAYSAALLASGITNGDFSINNNQDPNYSWQTNGATTIGNGIATLSDTSKQLANLTQKFLIPANATKLQFTIKDAQLGIRPPNSSPAPNDSFEVALLDAQTMNSLVGTAKGLANTDSLLNLQADGTAYFSDKVQIAGATTSGAKIGNTGDRTVTVDLTGIASNTQAMLYFDLLSFSSGASHVSIDDVKIFNSTQAAPHLDNATLATNQATGLEIPLPNGVTLDRIQLGTQPQHGTVARNPLDGKITYTPNSDYVGADSFTYLGFDANGQATNPATINITVNNVAPTIESIITPTTVKEGQSIQLSATAKDGGSSNNLTYTWNLGDGSNPIVGQNISYTYADNGNYNVTLSVTDKDGGTTNQSTQIKVDNVAPSVTLFSPTNTINQGEALNLSVNYTDPGINDTHTITWNFGDGSNPVTGVSNPSHIFTKAGSNNVSVTVTDNDGASTTQSLQISVKSVAPTINSLDLPTNINEGQLVQLTANATGDGALTYNWYVDNAKTPLVGKTIDYTFADNGIYAVKLSVIDSNGIVTTQSVDVTVNNVVPTIVSIIKPTQINEGQPVLFKAVARDPGVNDTLAYSWNFGDNTPVAIGQNVIHTFADNGNYNVALTVIDKDGAATTQTVAITVDNAPPVIVSIVKPAQIKEGESVEFKATATDTGVNDTLTYSWNFGDNTNPVSGQNVTHTFVDNGNYNVTLTVTDKDGAATTQTIVARVDNVAPTIVSIVKPTQINEGQSAIFAATANDPGTLDTLTYSWNFGDNTTPVSGQNVNHTFADNGNYNVVLTVTDKDGGVTTQTVVTKVDNVAPTIVSIDKPSTIKEGESVLFKATATDPGTVDTLTYSWNFGDNTNSVTGQNVSHTFADNGNYNVVLTVTDKDGGFTTQTVVAKVDNVAPTIVSIAKPATIKEGESVTFSATATDPGILDTLSYSWNFGDNSTAVIGQNVNHTFADNGNYNVVLTVTDKDGGVTTKTVVAKVDNVAPSIVNITKPTQINEGQAVAFSAIATDPGILDTLTYSWNFGDTTPAVAGQFVNHTFADNGNYNVVLTVTDKDGGVTTKTVVAKVDNVAPTIVSIATPSTIKEGESVIFSTTATDPGILDTLSYSWNFGDNSTPVNGQNVNHTFADNGNYNVVLTVTDKDGGVTTQTVVASVDNVAPTVVSIAKPSTIKEGESVTFSATATDPGTQDTLTYSWNFGDNTSPMAGQNVTHTFADNGNYNVVLTVTDKDGAATTQTVVAKVDNIAPTIVSIVKPTQINEGQGVAFSATATDPGILDALTYSWNFGDNTNPVTGQNATHTFADNGNYNVVLTVTDKDGAATTQTVITKVDNVAPTIVNITKPNQINEGQAVAFSATANDPGTKDTLTYSWNFGDNTTPVIGQNINHTFVDNGSYNVTLTVTDKDGGVITQTVVANVNNVAPVIVSIDKPTTIKEGESVLFKATATDAGINDSLTYAWNFGDNTTPVTGQNVNHTFADNGNYNVVLTVTDKDGGVTTQTVAAKVDNVAPVIANITKPDKINEGQVVAFSATATDPGTKDTLTYVWNFGDNTTPVAGQNVNHTFADNGNYNVTLTVTDKDGAATTQTVVAKVDNVAPTIVSIVKPTQINEGASVAFSATATDPGIKDTLTYSWNFGDNTTPVAGQNVNHTFADNGNYNVVLTVTDKDAGVTTQTTAVKVDNVAPTIVSIAKPTQINEGQSVAFTATATDPGILDTLTYSWNFGDNTTAVSGQNVTHTFADNGNYNVVLIVTDKDGGVTTQTTAVKVDNVAPTIVSIAKPTTINEGQAVTFTATATDPGILDTLTYSWNFGDTTTPVSGQNVNHIFADNGNYNVVLTVTDKDGGVTTQAVVAKVDNVAPSIVSIVKPTTINEGQSVNFAATATDLGILDTLTYSWNFGDNTTAVSGQNVTHAFADNGNYNVVLTVTDKDGGVTTQTTAVKVDNVAPTIVSIAKPTQINEGQLVTFAATATDPGILDTLTYSWNFGDNTILVTGKNVAHTFAQDGNYNVVLIVTDKDGGITTQTVAAKVDNVAPTIVSIAKPTQINEGQAVTFTATATDPGILDTLTYSWNFGDNTTAVSGQNVNHTFVDNGNYNVVLTVTDKDGGVTTQTTAVKVDNVAPTIVSIAKPTQINEGQAVAFSTTATDPGILDTLTYSWNFGDNTTAISGQNVNHTFADNGNYNVVLTVTDKDGGVTTQTVAVKVDNVAPTIVSIVKPTQINEGQVVTFAATATDPGIKDTLTYSWNFGDTTTPVSGQNVNHTFADNGNYNVVLTVTDKDGGVTTQTVAVKVDNVAPVIVNIVKPATINEGQSIQFTATATDPGIKDTLTYSWNFGDTTIPVSGQNATHTFADNGNYNVVLTVTDKDGGVTTQTVAVKVDNVAPVIATVTLPQNVVAGNVAQFTANATDVGIKDTLTYAWNFGDNTALTTGQNSTHIYTVAGTYSVILTVTDKDGAITTSTQNLTVTAPTSSGGIRAGGIVTVNGSANFDGSSTTRTDDTQIYAAKGITLNGNITLPVKRDAAGNPLKVNGKIVLTDNEITVGAGVNITTNPSQYTNIATATQTITIPNYADIKLQEFTPLASAVVTTLNLQTTPIYSSADWNTKFPPAGTASNPTVVRIINGDLNLPANINLSNYILIVENGNINFYQGNPVLNNVKLIANAGNINLNSTTGTNLSLSASGNINITGNTSLGGISVINSNGNINTNGGLSMVNSSATVKMIANGDLTVNGNTSLKGQLFSKKNVTMNGQTTLVGSVDALLNVTIGGNSTILAK